MKKTLSAFLLASLVGGILALACKHAEEKNPTDESAPVGVRKEALRGVEPLALAIAKDARYQPEVKMMAWAEGETVQVQLANASDIALRISDENFGVIRKGERTVYPFVRSQYTSQFPNGVGLEPGQVVTGKLTFTGLGDLAGDRLVFNHAHAAKSLALIQGKGEPVSSVQVPVATPGASKASNPVRETKPVVTPVPPPAMTPAPPPRLPLP